MIVDSSAILAIIRNEPEAAAFAEALEDAVICRTSAAIFLEAAIVTDANGDPVLSGRLDDLIEEAGVIIEPFTEEQARLAREAYRKFGKGSGHPAKLNYGDCMVYALARHLREPLLFKGDDFRQTDITPALS